MHLSKLRDDIQSLTLLAPMLEFVDAFVDAGRAYTQAAHQSVGDDQGDGEVNRVKKG